MARIKSFESMVRSYEKLEDEVLRQKVVLLRAAFSEERLVVGELLSAMPAALKFFECVYDYISGEDISELVDLGTLSGAEHYWIRDNCTKAKILRRRLMAVEAVLTERGYI
jgi:hypothetical protein